MLRFEVERDAPTKMPRDAQLLPEAQIRVELKPREGMHSGAHRRDTVHVWAEVDGGSDLLLRGRMLHVVCTGDPIPGGASWAATAMLDRSATPDGSPLVLHVYDGGWVA